METLMSNGIPAPPSVHFKHKRPREDEDVDIDSHETVVVDDSPSQKLKHQGKLIKSAKWKRVRPFRIFDLPRELRNKIYSYAVTESTDYALTRSRSWHRHPWIRIDNVPVMSALLANRQISTEYQEEVQGKQVLNIYDPLINVLNHAIVPDHGTIDWPQTWKNVTQCVVHFSVYCTACTDTGIRDPDDDPDPDPQDTPGERFLRCQACTGSLQMAVMHLRQKVLGSLSQLNSIEYKLGLWWLSDRESEWPAHLHDPGLTAVIESLLSIPNSEAVQSCQIFLIKDVSMYILWRDGHLILDDFATWTRELGWKPGPSRGISKETEEQAKTMAHLCAPEPSSSSSSSAVEEEEPAQRQRGFGSVLAIARSLIGRG